MRAQKNHSLQRGLRLERRLINTPSRQHQQLKPLQDQLLRRGDILFFAGRSLHRGILDRVQMFRRLFGRLPTRQKGDTAHGRRYTLLRRLTHRFIDEDRPAEILADPERGDDELPVSPSVFERRRDADRLKTPGDGGGFTKNR